MSQILGEGTRVPVPQPHGLYEILGTFGDIFDYIHPDHTLDPRWQTDFLESTTLPFPMVLSRDRTRTVHQITCHKVLSGIVADVYKFRVRVCKTKSPASAAAFHSARNEPAPSFQHTPGESQLI